MKKITLAICVAFLALNAHAAPATPVTEAHCEPQLDDACTVNNKKVPKAQLGKYLPKVDSDEVEAEGGYCEYPICYSEDDTPIGIRTR